MDVQENENIIQLYVHVVLCLDVGMLLLDNCL
jgi:hypothetical protein